VEWRIRANNLGDFLMNRLALAAIAASCVLTAACAKEAAPVAAITEAEAGKLADAMVKGWESKDAATIKALYAPGVVAFDYAYGPLEADRATFDKAQDEFAAAQIDSEEQISRNIQLLDADTFIVSGVWNGTSKAKPENNGQVRCTDVFQKDAAGAWSIVNEHCSRMPKAV
jgi:ketosteroid isomerase-like protein